MTDIVVIGKRPTATTSPPPNPGYVYAGFGGDYFPGQSGDTSGWDQSLAYELQQWKEKTEKAKETPCFTKVPASVNKSDMNDHAKAVGTAMSAITDKFEYSVILYQNNGSIEKTPLFTSGRADRATIDTSAVPAGSTIIAIIHNHPDRDLPIDATPSPHDSNVVNDLMTDAVNDPTIGWRVDPLTVLYIFDANTGKTFVYDRDHRLTNTPSCDL